MSRLLCVFSRIRQKGIKFMTENEKKLLQTKHRLEEAEMRDRQKERKARTRRLIQEGAILEKALPQTTQMTLEQLEDFLCEVFKPIRGFL